MSPKTIHCSANDICRCPIVYVRRPAQKCPARRSGDGHWASHDIPYRIPTTDTSADTSTDRSSTTATTTTTTTTPQRHRPAPLSDWRHPWPPYRRPGTTPCVSPATSAPPASPAPPSAPYSTPMTSANTPPRLSCWPPNCSPTPTSTPITSTPWESWRSAGGCLSPWGTGTGGCRPASRGGRTRWAQRRVGTGAPARPGLFRVPGCVRVRGVGGPMGREASLGRLRERGRIAGHCSPFFDL